MTKRRTFGTVRKLPSGRYQAVIWHEGKKRALGTFPSRADANKHLSTVETDMARGAWVDPAAAQDITFSEYAESWITRRSGVKLRATTEAKYRGLLDRYILPTFGDHHMSAITADQVEAWYYPLKRAHSSTAAGAYRLLATIFNTAVKNGDVTKPSPCRVEGGASEAAVERPIIARDELQRAVDAMPAQYRAAALLAAWCQLRRSEVLGLQRGDVDLETGLIHICRSWVVTSDGHRFEQPPKTEAGDRTLYMTEDVCEAVRTHLAAYVAPQADAWLFPNRDGTAPMVHRTFSRVWERARRVSGREDLRFHDLRHTGLTWFARTGATEREIMKRGGHRSPAAARRYQHEAEAEREKMLVARMAAQ
jgi:integrase